MTNDDQRAMINRIAYALLDTLDGTTVTKEFKKVYSGSSSAKNVDKKFQETEAIGLPNIADNIMEDGQIKKEYTTSEYKYTEMVINGETTVVKSEEPVTEPNTEKLSEATNRATALTYAFALFIELNRIQDELDEESEKIAELESKISSLEDEIKTLKSALSGI